MLLYPSITSRLKQMSGRVPGEFNFEKYNFILSPASIRCSVDFKAKLNFCNNLDFFKVKFSQKNSTYAYLKEKVNWADSQEPFIYI